MADLAGLKVKRMAIVLEVNGTTHEVDVPDDMPLLWVVRDVIGLTGTKYGCGIQQCGACTVHIDGVAARSCGLPVGGLDGAKITTIEGLAGPEGDHPLQAAWAEHDVPQCGYCQSGQIMQAASFLEGATDPSDDAIRGAMAGNICRCGTYGRIFAAIRQVAEAG